MRAFALVPAVLLLAACNAETYHGPLENSSAGFVSPLVDQGTPSPQPSGTVAMTSVGEPVMMGSMVTAESLDFRDTTGTVDVWDNFLSFHFDTFTPTGWAMMAGSVELDEPLRVGQTISIDRFDILGCAGPAIADYDFDGPAEGDGEIVVGAEVDGGFLITISSGFGSVGQMEATVSIEDMDRG